MKDGGSEGEDKKRVSRGDAKGGVGREEGWGGEAAKQNAKRKDGAVFSGTDRERGERQRPTAASRKRFARIPMEQEVKPTLFIH